MTNTNLTQPTHLTFPTQTQETYITTQHDTQFDKIWGCVWFQGQPLLMARSITDLGTGGSLVVLFLCLTTHFSVLPFAEAVWFPIPTTGTKCMSEEIQKNVVVLADYYVVTENGPQISTVSVKVCLLIFPTHEKLCAWSNFLIDLDLHCWILLMLFHSLCKFMLVSFIYVAMFWYKESNAWLVSVERTSLSIFTVVSIPITLFSSVRYKFESLVKKTESIAFHLLIHVGQFDCQW